MRETKTQIMEGVEAKESKIVGNNTVEYIRPDGTKVIRFHHTDILEFPAPEEVVFNTGGWKTVTTKQRMNEFQNLATIIQHKGLWYITTHKDIFDPNNYTPYFDGIKIRGSLVVNPKDSAHKKRSILDQKNQ